MRSDSIGQTPIGAASRNVVACRSRAGSVVGGAPPPGVGLGVVPGRARARSVRTRVGGHRQHPLMVARRKVAAH